MGANDGSYIMTLVNSIIGVSILAMPFCYKQCGIILASLILIFSNLMTRLSCHYLLKSAIMTRRRTYELLAFHTFGGSGKTAVELCIILLMIGTCIAFFVVMGDLGPSIIGPLLQVEYSAALRPAVLIGLAVFVVLPLGLLRNVDSLSSICTASFLFYLILVMKVFIESMDNLFSLSWLNEIQYWRPAGILQCLPIFSMALSCQTQLLEIFDSVQNGTLEKMNSIVKSAVNLCTIFYMAVGFLGYVAYYKRSFTGNLLMSFSSTHFSESIKLGFVLSVAVTFPLVIFPCRRSLHSLLFKKVYTPHYELITGGANHIPTTQFRCITFFIITLSLVVGLLAPNIEIVLGLLGSTIGVIICVLCPPFIFTWISNKATTEKILAQTMCMFGLFIMVMGTYANLYLSDSSENAEQSQNWKIADTNMMKILLDEPLKQLEEKEMMNIARQEALNVDSSKNLPISKEKISKDAKRVENILDNKKAEDKRIEPPIPQDPEAIKEQMKPQNSNQQKENVSKNLNANLNDELKGKENNDQKPSVSKATLNFGEEPKEVEKKEETLEKMPENVDVIKSKGKVDVAPKSVKRDRFNSSDKKIKMRKIQASNNAKASEEPKKDEVSIEKASLNESPKLIKEQPPLPLLVKIQNSSDAKGKSIKSIAQRSNLDEKSNIVDREKRDLYYVSNTLKADGNVVENDNVEVNGTIINIEKKKEHLPVRENENSKSFVHNVAETNDAKQVCKKDKVEVIETEKKENEMKNRDDNSHTSKSEIQGKMEKVSNSSIEAEEEKVSISTEKDTLVSSKWTDSNLELSKVKLEETIDHKKTLILSPSKLTNPDFLLQDKLYVEEKNPIMLDIVQSMSRELKTIEKETGNRKK